MTPTIINEHSVRDLAMGGAVLCAGANSFPYIGYLAAREALSAQAPVPLISPLALADDARVALVAIVGAPLVLLERFVDTDQFIRALNLLVRHLGAPFDAVMPYEVGATNSVIPVMVCSKTGLPLVDADTLGRSFPELQMSSFAIAGIDMAPLAICDIRCNDLILVQTSSARSVERIVRTIATTWGSLAAICGAYTGRDVKRHAIHGTYTRALRLGGELLRAQAAHRDVVEALLSVEHGVELVRGKIVDVERRATDGFVRGHAVVETFGHTELAVIRFQNEYILVEVGGRRRAMVPDLISVFDSERGEPIGTEALRYGRRVTVVRFPALDRHLTPAALSILGPRALGFDFDYAPSTE
jgi:uncharacterized protein